MNLKNRMLKMTTVAAVVFSFIACEDDFETIGSDVIGEPGFNAELYDEAEITASTFKYGPVQTNNTQLNLLGVYQDPVFGTQEASVLTSLMLTNSNPSFGNEPVLDSVVLSIPFFSREVSVGDSTEFKLDSIYGEGPIKLTITESNFYLNNFDPETNFEKSQKYYSNMEPRILSNLTSNVLLEVGSFSPSNEPIVEYSVDSAGEADTLSLGPAIRLHLNKQFFQTKILDKGGSSELLNQNNIKDYFRGIYINADQVNNEGTMMLLNLLHENAGIVLYYTTNLPDVRDADDDGDEEELVEARRSYKLNFGTPKVNTFQQEMPDFTGEDDLYLKGGEGSMAVIELFSGPDADGNGVSDQLEALREVDWLINEANLIFHVNRDLAEDLDEPERVYIYDLDNNRVLYDYQLNAMQESNPVKPISVHLPPLTQDENGNGLSYKVRLTNHINNIVNKDSANVRLGLAVSQNVSLTTSSALLQQDEVVKRVPAASVITPEATVLYGPNAEDVEKRLKLNIYYTEPKN